MTLVEDDAGDVSDVQEARVDEAHAKDFGGANQHIVGFLARVPLGFIPVSNFHAAKLDDSAGGDVAVRLDVACLLLHERARWNDEDDLFGLVLCEEVIDELHRYQRLARALLG